ncbi:hypothetical protein ACOT81_18270 [Streptomyces sp. WI04-05B]|uniref:hypothetical protein n=1 Tax=Streptomyces TaxID=1883 RepID=UPI0039F5B4E7
MFVDEHAEALEADLLRFYGTDLLDWHRGRLSSRRLAVLVKHLPRDCALNRELHGEAAEWSIVEHLLAATVDHLAAANWMFASVNSAEDADPPELPVPVPRPEDGRLGRAGEERYGSTYRDGFGDGSEEEAEADDKFGEPGTPQPPASTTATPSQVARFFG